MAPGPGQNSPIVIGMTERARRPIVLGNLYVVFYKGYKTVQLRLRSPLGIHPRGNKCIPKLMYRENLLR